MCGFQAVENGLSWTFKVIQPHYVSELERNFPCVVSCMLLIVIVTKSVTGTVSMQRGLPGEMTNVMPLIAHLALASHSHQHTQLC